MEILSWHFWSHRASDRCLNFFSGQGTLVVRIILLQIVNHSLRISEAAHTSSLWNPQKFGSFRSQGVKESVVIWLAWTCSRYFVNSSCAVLQLAKLKENRWNNRNIKHSQGTMFNSHEWNINFTKNQVNWTIPEPTVRLSWMKRWNVAWSMYFGRPRSAKCLWTWLRKLKTQRDSSTIDQTWPNCHREVRFPQNLHKSPLPAAKDPDPPWGSSPGSAWPARGVPPEVLELRWSARRPGRWNSWFRRTACCGPRPSPTEGSISRVSPE